MSSDLSILKTLTDAAMDSVLGYEKAAERATDERLQQVLREQASTRRATVQALNDEIVRLGGEPRTRGSAAGAAHRAWAALADAFGDSDENAAERVEEGEDYLCEKFEDAIDEGELSPETLAVVERAYEEIAEGERITDALEEAFD